MTLNEILMQLNREYTKRIQIELSKRDYDVEKRNHQTKDHYKI